MDGRSMGIAVKEWGNDSGLPINESDGLEIESN